MAKNNNKVVVNKINNITTNSSGSNMKLYNSTQKYNFILEFKYDKVYLSISRKNVSDFHIGTFILSSIDEIKTDNRFRHYLQLIDIDKFISNFTYND